MLRPRIIPCLLIHQGGLVKTVNFKDPKYVGDPVNAMRIFNEKEADELMVIDIDASRDGVEPNFRLMQQFATECRMPLCYGGGVKSVEQASRIISLGIEKVSVSSAAVETPELVPAIAREVGSQSVVIVLDVRKNAKGAYDVYTRNGSRNVGKDVVSAAKEAESLGAGEIVVNSIDNDGTMAGYDLDLARSVRQAVRVPVTFLGGAGSLDHMRDLIHTCGVVGAAAGSFFVFKGARRAVLISYPDAAAKESLFQAEHSAGVL